MAKSIKKLIQEKLNRIKKSVDPLINFKTEKSNSKLILQPIRIKNI